MKITKLDFEIPTSKWINLKKIICHFQVQNDIEGEDFDTEITKTCDFVIVDPISLTDQLVLTLKGEGIEKKYKINPILFKDKLEKLVQENPKLEIVDDCVKFKN